MFGRPEHDPGHRDGAQEKHDTQDNHRLNRHQLGRDRLHRDLICPFFLWAQWRATLCAGAGACRPMPTDSTNNTKQPSNNRKLHLIYAFCKILNSLKKGTNEPLRSAAE